MFVVDAAAAAAAALRNGTDFAYKILFEFEININFNLMFLSDNNCDAKISNVIFLEKNLCPPFYHSSNYVSLNCCHS